MYASPPLTHTLQYGAVKEEYVIKVPKERAPEGLELNDQVWYFLSGGRRARAEGGKAKQGINTSAHPTFETTRSPPQHVRMNGWGRKQPPNIIVCTDSLVGPLHLLQPYMVLAGVLTAAAGCCWQQPGPSRSAPHRSASRGTVGSSKC